MSTKILRKGGKLIFKISIILVDIVCVFVKITTSKHNDGREKDIYVESNDIITWFSYE